MDSALLSESALQLQLLASRGVKPMSPIVESSGEMSARWSKTSSDTALPSGSTMKAGKTLWASAPVRAKSVPPTEAVDAGAGESEPVQAETSRRPTTTRRVDRMERGAGREGEDGRA